MKLSHSTVKQLLTDMTTGKDDQKVLTQALGLSALAYFSNQFIQTQLTKLDMTCKIFENSGMKCVVSETPTHVYIAFRGTMPSSWSNWKRIVNIIPKMFVYGIEVHGGFELYYKEYLKIIKSYIDSIVTKKQIVFTGHSLGAAIAALFNIGYVNNSTSITFGSSKYLFNNKFESTNSISYRINKDFVTYLPFSLPFLKWYRSSKTVKIKSKYNSINPIAYHSLNNYIKSIIDP